MSKPAAVERSGEISVVRHGAVALIVIDRPPLNFASVAMMRALADALEAIDADPDLRASVIAAQGKAFCAGADLGGAAEEAGLDGEGPSPLYAQAVRLFAAKKPIVAVVQGAAVGAGLGLALVADFRIAAPEARFCANFVALGFHPGFGISHTLARVIGRQRAQLMLLTGRRIKADAALGWGLVDAVVPADQLRGAALELAQEIAANAPLAVQSTRATLRAGLAEAVAQQTVHELAEQRRLRATADYAEGVRAVAERRPGRFVGA